ncbi:MAG TPA: hypothetical protein VN043_03130, partial [Rhodanobacter sp.]|nr:hypothetical protein [Rhodanobacter sp.]
MTIWELRCAAVNDYAMLVPLDRDDVEEDTFDASGTAKHWKGRPLVGFHVEKRRKAQKPRADVSLLIPGALVLGEKAHAALGSFLSTFGQLLELDCHGETRYFYNMTQIVSCIDKDRSELFEDGGIMREGRFCVTPRFCCCASYDLLFCKCS